MTLMRGARARWKIENETFNTLKNQGYHFEHNFGHGDQPLRVGGAILFDLVAESVQNLGVTPGRGPAPAGHGRRAQRRIRCPAKTRIRAARSQRGPA
jgi:hypothetical protein